MLSLWILLENKKIDSLQNFVVKYNLIWAGLDAMSTTLLAEWNVSDAMPRGT